MFDVEVGVVGAGPAGALVSERLAALGADVVLWDAKAPWEKPCGGGLSAAALAEHRELAELGSTLHLVRAARLELAEGPAIEVPLEQPLGIVSRLDLARWQLARARAAGATFCQVAVRLVERLPGGGWRLTTREGVRHRVRHLVGADGAASCVRANAAPSLRVTLEPTRVAYLPASAPTGDVLTLRFEAGVTGYSWDFPRNDHHSVGAACAPGERTRVELDADVDCLGARLGRGTEAPSVRQGAVIGSALHLRRQDYAAMGSDDLALIGDAAGLADPLSGEGMHNALRSAALAVDAFALHRDFRSYGRWAADRFEPEFRIARLARRILHTHQVAVRLIAWSVGHPAARALVIALLNGANDHRRALVVPWLRALRQVIRDGYDRRREVHHM